MVFKLNYIFLLSFVALIITNQAIAAEVDPTRPFGHRASSTVTSSGNKLVLESIIHGDGIHTVVISGKVLKMYDYIGEYQLAAVNDQSVVLRSKTKHFKLAIFKNNAVKISIAK